MTPGARFARLPFVEGLSTDREDAEQLDNIAVEHDRRLLVACAGMAFEAKIVAGPNILVFRRDNQRELSTASERAARQGDVGIISFGVAGGPSRLPRCSAWVEKEPSDACPQLGACPSSDWRNGGESDSLRGYEQGFSRLED
jgi:hypothetical protein